MKEFLIESKPTKLIALLLLILSIFYAVAYFLVLNSDAYRYGKEFISESKDISSKIGEVEKTSLAPFPLKIGVSGNSGHAELKVHVSTPSHAVHVVRLDMRKVAGKWSVINASLDGQKLLTTPK